MARRRVDFPQPEGPRRKKTSPAWMSRETSSRATVSPNFLETWSMRTDVMVGDCSGRGKVVSSR